MTPLQRAVLERLRRGRATLADLRAALPDDHVERRASPSMGEPDDFGAEVAELERRGEIVDEQGHYRLPGPGERAPKRS